MDKILVVEDDESMNDVLVRTLEGMGLKALSALNSKQAMELSLANTFALVVTDVILPGQDGMECLSTIRALQPTVRCIVITGYARKEIPAQAMRLKISDYLLKPFRLDTFVTSVNQALDMDERRRKLARQLERILPGASKRTEENIEDLIARRTDTIRCLYVGIRSGLLTRRAAMEAYSKIEFFESRFRKVLRAKEPDLKLAGKILGYYEGVRQGIIGYRGEPEAEEFNIDVISPDQFYQLHERVLTSQVGLLDLEYAPILRLASDKVLESTPLLLSLRRSLWPSTGA